MANADGGEVMLFDKVGVAHCIARIRPLSNGASRRGRLRLHPNDSGRLARPNPLCQNMEDGRAGPCLDVSLSLEMDSDHWCKMQRIVPKSLLYFFCVAANVRFQENR